MLFLHPQTVYQNQMTKVQQLGANKPGATIVVVSIKPAHNLMKTKTPDICPL